MEVRSLLLWGMGKRLYPRALYLESGIFFWKDGSGVQNRLQKELLIVRSQRIQRRFKNYGIFLKGGQNSANKGAIMKTKIGTLYGIGVGPGDPDLITLKSAKILNRVHVVFTAASTKNNHSLAVNIAKPHIPETTSIRMLSFPMTKDKKETRKSWAKNACIIINELEQGKDVAFLTVGDSMTYSTYGYILKHVKASAPYMSIEIHSRHHFIPGSCSPLEHPLGGR